MINLGIVGLGPVWESRYRPVLEKLRHRVRVRAVYDTIASRGEQVAFEFGAIPYQGVTALLAQPDLRGILVLDTSWHGNALLHFVRKARKPAYIAGSLGEDWNEILELRSLVESEGLLVMPEFSRRFTPATCRLRELIATRLGRPRHIAIHAVPPAADAPDAIPGQAGETDFLVGLLDWCRYVVRSTAVMLESAPLRHDGPHEGSHEGGSRSIAIEFAEMRDIGRRPTVVLELHRPPQPAGQKGVASGVCFTVACERGEAVLEGPAHIRWSISGEEGKTESLTADRSEVEVMIDHFCRRLAGGLIPIADISDVCRCLRLVHAAKESHAKRSPVHLNGDVA
jgi:predicted dehydrogenase